MTDVDRLARMFERLSRESVLSRFFSPVPHLPRSLLLRLADVDHDRRDALVALDGDEIVAVRAIRRGADEGVPREAEIALTVEDAWQNRGVGRRLVRRLALLAHARGFEAFVATILPDNRAALTLMRKLVPDAQVRFAGRDYEARLPLSA